MYGHFGKYPCGVTFIATADRSTGNASNVRVPVEYAGSHGNKCGVGTIYAIGLYNMFFTINETFGGLWFITRPLCGDATSGGATFGNVVCIITSAYHGDHWGSILTFVDSISHVRGRGTTYTMNVFGAALAGTALARGYDLLIAYGA